MLCRSGSGKKTSVLSGVSIEIRRILARLANRRYLVGTGEGKRGLIHKEPIEKLKK